MEDSDPIPVDYSVPVPGQHYPDQLSELPDMPLVHILSHLPFHEAARAGLISKRFNSLWNSVSQLSFSDQSSGKSGDQFVKFVDEALGFHRRAEIEKFAVEFGYSVTHGKAVDAWIRFAVEKQVKVLNLNLAQNRLNLQFYEYKLPKFLYRYQNLLEFVTCCCEFSKNKRISWNSLKVLSISSTKLDEGVIRRILSGCPVLETLELKEWCGFDRLKIQSASLRVLRIVGEEPPKYVVQPDDECLLEISGPNVVSLEVSGPLYRTKVRLMEIRSLANATMDFEVRPQWFGIKRNWYACRDQDIAREVLESLCHVNKLTVGGWFIKVLSTCEQYNLSPSLSNRKSLTLSIPVIKWDHLGIASILYSSPYLETLTIRISCCSDVFGLWHIPASSNNNHNEEYYWMSWSAKSRCPLLHLKTVKVVNFHASCGATKLFHFLQFILRNSNVLEEVIIEASNFVTEEALSEGLNLVSDNVPKASPDVVVQFEPPHLWVDPFCFNKNLDPY